MPAERKSLYPILGVDEVAEIFAYLDDAEPYLKELSRDEAAKVISNMDSDDAADALEDLDEIDKGEIVNKLDSVSVGMAMAVLCVLFSTTALLILNTVIDHRKVH